MTVSLLAACPAGAGFVTFESGQVRPLALSPAGTHLFAVDTPDDRLEIFDVVGGALTHRATVPVGLEPVAVAPRTESEVWVVNHLSDSVSVVDVGSSPPRVVHTLLVGDEPRDIVFAGPGGSRAFITCAHRGQNNPNDPQLTTPSVGRADVWVFDALDLGSSLGGTPLSIVTLFGDTPRALAVSPDGHTVYAAVFHSGNRTTTVSEGAVCNGGASAAPCTLTDGSSVPGGLPAPNADTHGNPGPETGLVVKFVPDNPAVPDVGHWKDRPGRIWDNAVRFSLPDDDVFRIDAMATPPAPEPSAPFPGKPFAHVGTVLFNMAVNPVSGKVYVSNTEAHNEVRFEGPGGGGSTVRGHLHEARITVLDPAPAATAPVLPIHLNKHLEPYTVVPSPAGTSAKSLAIPLGLAVTSDGKTLYVAAFGSSKIGVFDTTALETNAFTPDPADHIVVTGGGPSGLVLDEAHKRLYVLTRFDDAISVIDTTTSPGAEIAHLPLYNPEPLVVKNGRHVLYDANLTSSNGEASCASCHVFADFDSLAWDLGNPDNTPIDNPNPFEFSLGVQPFHPLKGPMTTQSLRGLANNGPMHWRGDRTGGNDPGGDALDEGQAFGKFIVAFDGLLGHDGPISDADMRAFTDFVLQVTYPPNPIRGLDNQVIGDQLVGHDLYMGRITDSVRNCNGCHTLDPANGQFGTRGFSSFENETQLFKIPHLRNAYQKVGMFGMPPVGFFRGGNNGNQGAQVRGFGFLHDGSVDTLFRFHGASVFNTTDQERAQLEQFVLAFDSDLAPIVGQQITLTSPGDAVAGARIDRLIAQAAAGECDLVVKGTLAGLQRGWYRTVAGTFQGDRREEAPLSDTGLRAQAATPGQERTYTCVPPGSGLRIGVDRDEDGFFDRDELDAGTDPANPASVPGGPAVLIGTRTLILKDSSTAAKRRFTFQASTRHDPSANRIVLPLAGGSGDPTHGGGTVTVYNAAGTAETVFVTLPPSDPATGSRWSAIGRAPNVTGYRYRGKSHDGPISQILVQAERITIKGGRTNWSYTLNEPSQSRIAVRLSLGQTGGWCADAAAKVSGNPPSTAANDKVGKFVAQPKSPPPAACPPIP